MIQRTTPLEEKTQQYWHLAKSFRGLTGAPITVETLLQQLGVMKECISSEKVLKTCAKKLLDDVIRYGRPPRVRKRSRHELRVVASIGGNQ